MAAPYTTSLSRSAFMPCTHACCRLHGMHANGEKTHESRSRSLTAFISHAMHAVRMPCTQRMDCMHAACLHFDAWHARSRLHARMRQACPAGMPCACIQDRRSGAGTSATRVRCAGQVAAARGHGASAAGTRADQRRAATELCHVAARLAPKSWPPRATDAKGI